MSNSIILTVNLFGAFRMGGGKSVMLTLPKGVGLDDIRQALKSVLDNHPLIDSSVLADEKRIFTKDVVFEHNAELAILPPVCGG